MLRIKLNIQFKVESKFDGKTQSIILQYNIGLMISIFFPLHRIYGVGFNRFVASIDSLHIFINIEPKKRYKLISTLFFGFSNDNIGLYVYKPKSYFQLFLSIFFVANQKLHQNHNKICVYCKQSNR